MIRIRRRSGSGAAEGTSWLSGGLLRRLRCLRRGHCWGSQPAIGGVVLVLCARCGELVSAAFVDQAEVLGLADAGADCWLGATTASRVAVDLVAAVIAQDEEARRRLRREAAARPGDSVDALAQLAAVLSRMGAPGRPRAALHSVADQMERSVLERELLADGPRLVGGAS